MYAGAHIHAPTLAYAHTNRCSHKACKFHYSSKILPLQKKKRIWVNLVNTGSELPQELRGGEVCVCSLCVCLCTCVCVCV